MSPPPPLGLLFEIHGDLEEFAYIPPFHPLPKEKNTDLYLIAYHNWY